MLMQWYSHKQLLSVVLVCVQDKKSSFHVIHQYQTMLFGLFEDGNFSGSAVGFNDSIIWNFRIKIVERVTIFPFSIVSTATLKNVLFSHNNTKIKCTSLDTSPPLISSESKSVLVLGELNSSLVVALNAFIYRYSSQ